jgi:RNA polymerase sigma factor (sigma-70 family)
VITRPVGGWSRRTCDWSSRSPRRIAGQGVDFEDLIQEGSIGLARAVDKKETLALGRVTSSLNEPASDDDELGSLVRDESAEAAFERATAELDDELRLRPGLDRLPERQREVLELRLGLDGLEPLTLDEVGQRLGVTRERARQIEQQAYAALGRRFPRRAA